MGEVREVRQLSSVHYYILRSARGTVGEVARATSGCESCDSCDSMEQREVSLQCTLLCDVEAGCAA